MDLFPHSSPDRSWSWIKDDFLTVPRVPGTSRRNDRRLHTRVERGGSPDANASMGSNPAGFPEDDFGATTSESKQFPNGHDLWGSRTRAVTLNKRSVIERDGILTPRVVPHYCRLARYSSISFGRSYRMVNVKSRNRTASRTSRGESCSASVSGWAASLATKRISVAHSRIIGGSNPSAARSSTSRRRGY